MTGRLWVVGLVVLALLVGVLDFFVPQPQSASGADVEIIRDVRYFRGPGSSAERNSMDFFLPAESEQFPFVLFLHGGNWSSGDKNERPGEYFDNVGHALAGRGVGVALANYRLSDQSASHVVHPGHVEDVARAVSFARAYLNARGTDPTDFFLLGHDAGAHLAALLATNGRFLAEQGLAKSDIRGVVGLSGIYRIDPDGSEWTDVFGNDPAMRLDASPIDHVQGDEPPMLLLHAAYDLPDRGPEADAFGRTLRTAGVEAGVLRVDDRDHWTLVEDIGQPGDVTTALILHFVSSHAAPTPTPERTVTATPTPSVTPTPTPGPAAGPTAPPGGPGGVERLHAATEVGLAEREGHRAWVVEPREPQPAWAPVVVVLGGVEFARRDLYGAWLDHMARGGYIVVYADYRFGAAPDARAMEDAAVGAYGAAMDYLSVGDHTRPQQSGVVWMGHGTGAMIAARLSATWFDRQLPEPRALLMMMPRAAPGGIETLHKVPRDTRTLLVFGRDDPGADPDLERAIWRGLSEIPGAWRQSLLIPSDRHGAPELIADFDVPFSGPEAGWAPNAHDWYGVWKWADALTTCALERRDCRYAFGDTQEQRFMGLWSDGVRVLEPEVSFGPPLDVHRTAHLPLVVKP